MSWSHQQDKASLLKKAISIPQATRGIYFLFSRGELVYVGQSRDIHYRVLRHRESKDFDSYSFIEIPESIDLSAEEKHYIEKFRPPLNCQVYFSHNCTPRYASNEALTEESMNTAKPAGSDYWIWCNLVKGFGVRVQPSGRKIFSIRFRDAEGRQRKKKIARCCDMSLDDARELARGMLASCAR